MAEQGPGILIVDHDDAVREAISAVLADAGIAWADAADGASALEAALDTSLGVVILGLQLPDMDGRAVLDRLRSLRPSLRVVVLSDGSDDESVLDALRNGACDYLATPIHDEELLLSARRAAESYGLADRWTKLRSRMERLVARLAELGAVPGEPAGADRLGAIEGTLVEATSEVLEAGKTSFMRLDDAGRWLEVVACVGRRLGPGEFDPVEVGQGIAGGVLERGEPLIVQDVAADPRIQGDHADGRYATSSFVAAPVASGDRRFGVLCATDRATGGAFSDEDLVLLRLLALQAAALMTNGAAAAFQPPDELADTATQPGLASLAVLPKEGEETELDRDAELSRQICQAIVDEVETSRVIREALRPIATLLPAAPVSIFLIDPADGSLRKEGECDGGVSSDRDELPRDRGLTGVVLQTGHLVATQDPASDSRFDPDWDTPSNGRIRPFLCIPLKLRGKVVGVFRGYLQEGADASARTAEVIGAALSAAVRNALLYRSLLEAIEDVAEARRAARS